MSVEQKIKKHLDDNGIKQSFVCEKTGLTSDVISRVCNGTRKLRASEFLSVCVALNINPSDFIEKK